MYNQKTRVFEVLDDAPEILSRDIKKFVIAELRKKKKSVYDDITRSRPTSKTEDSEGPVFDVCFKTQVSN